MVGGGAFNPPKKQKWNQLDEKRKLASQADTNLDPSNTQSPLGWTTMGVGLLSGAIFGPESAVTRATKGAAMGSMVVVVVR